MEAADRFLSARYGARAGPAAPLGAGEWSRAYAFTLDGREVVLRLGRYGEDYAKDRVMAAARGPHLPIPRVLELGETADGWFSVSERAHGVPLDACDADGIRAVLPDLLAVLDAVAHVDVRHRAGYGVWRPDGSAPHPTWRDALRQVADDERLPGWRRELQRSPIGAAAFDAASARLEALSADLPDTRQVIHADLLYHNVLVQGPRVAAVLDWGSSMYGDALYDAAWLLYWWPWYPRWAGIDIAAALRAHWAGVAPEAEHRLRCYQLHIGLSAMAYNAFTGRWDDLARNAAQTARLARGEA